MKTERNSVEGQMDIFEAMNRAAAAVDRMMEEEKAGPGKKNVEKKSAEKKNTGKITDGLSEGKKIVNKIQMGQEEHVPGETMHAAMQKTYLNPEDGDFATVAYIDYNMVYVRDWNSPVSLRKFDSSKEAVEYYLEQMEKIRMHADAELTSEHEPFVDVKSVAENLYVECD